MNEKLSTPLDLSASTESQVFDITKCSGFAVQLVWTGSPTGTAKIQGSLNGTVFSDIASASVATGGSSGDFLFNTSDLVHYHHIKIIYTSTSGTGSMDVWVGGKEQSI